jgi:deferrochelatase/peroxidase EfeB
LKYNTLTEKISLATVREKTERLRETVSVVFQKAQESDVKLAEKRREQDNRKTLFKSLGVGQQFWKRNLRAKTFADR